MNDVIKKEQLLPQTIDAVWNAITKAEEISTWFIKADFKAENGYRYTFTSSEEHGCTSITGEVKQSDPYKLVYTWVVERTDVVTTVSWELEAVEGGTMLYLEHSGIANYPAESAVNMFNSFNGGWDNCVNELSDYLKSIVNAG